MNRISAVSGRRHQAQGLMAAASAVALIAVTAPGYARGTAVSTPGGEEPSAADWPFAGQNLYDTRYNPHENIIRPSTVSTLKPRWVLTTGGNVTATPTVVRGTVYVPDYGGNLWAVDSATGKVVWKNPISRYSGIRGDISRNSPAYWQGRLILGAGVQTNKLLTGAQVMSLDARTGKPLWRTKVDSDPTAIITQSPVVADGVVYVGVSSKAEAINKPTAFRGSALALDARTGRVLWKRYMVPKGYTGGAIWGSTPVVDKARGLLYVTTGNNESVPAGVCKSTTATNCKPVAADDHIDAIVALSLRTGKVVWVRRTLASDTSTNFRHYGPDYDFGAGPNLFTTVRNDKRVQLLGAGQKSGMYWALDPATGKVVWSTEAGPGSLLGGIMWGTATDGRRIFVSIGNLNHVKYPIVSSSGKKSTTTGGFWAALDAATGKILWQTADPQLAYDNSAMSVANGVVYAGSMAGKGTNMYALDAVTGKIKWRFASGGAVTGGAAIVNGTAYWGSGYQTEAIGLGYPGNNNKLYAFSPAPNK